MEHKAGKAHDCAGRDVKEDSTEGCRIAGYSLSPRSPVL